MIAIFDTMSSVLEQVVESTDGHDLTGKGTVAAPADWEDGHEWDTSSRSFVKGSFKKAKMAAKTQINRMAESLYGEIARGGIIGEQLEPAKHAEAVAFLAAKKPSTDDFPLLKAEVGVSAMSMRALAQMIESKPAKKKSALMEMALLVEPLRLTACKAVDAAESRTEIAAVVNNLSFPESLT